LSSINSSAAAIQAGALHQLHSMVFILSFCTNLASPRLGATLFSCTIGAAKVAAPIFPEKEDDTLRFHVYNQFQDKLQHKQASLALWCSTHVIEHQH
jgi:hypothetical protein